MEINTIIRHTLITHESVEQLRTVIRQAAKDRRFIMTLADHRQFRDLVEDMGIMLDETWNESMKIPVELPANGAMQEISNQLKLIEAKSESMKAK